MLRATTSSLGRSWESPSSRRAASGSRSRCYAGCAPAGLPRSYPSSRSPASSLRASSPTSSPATRSEPASVPWPAAWSRPRSCPGDDGSSSRSFSPRPCPDCFRSGSVPDRSSGSATPPDPPRSCCWHRSAWPAPSNGRAASGRASSASCASSRASAWRSAQRPISNRRSPPCCGASAKRLTGSSARPGVSIPSRERSPARRGGPPTPPPRPSTPRARVSPSPPMKGFRAASGLLASRLGCTICGTIPACRAPTPRRGPGSWPASASRCSPTTASSPCSSSSCATLGTRTPIWCRRSRASPSSSAPSSSANAPNV